MCRSQRIGRPESHLTNRGACSLNPGMVRSPVSQETLSWADGPGLAKSCLTCHNVQAAGGRSTGPRTEAGKTRIAADMTVHGNSTRQARAELSAELMQLAMLKELALSIGMITTRSRGRRPGYRKG